MYGCMNYTEGHDTARKTAAKRVSVGCSNKCLTFFARTLYVVPMHDPKLHRTLLLVARSLYCKSVPQSDPTSKFLHLVQNRP